MATNKIIFTSLFLLMAINPIHAQQTKVIAHRGFWKINGSAQNSIAALVKADSIGCYGCEFDVWLTADQQLVVNHDEIFKGVIIQKAKCKVCTSIELDNGEQLPTLATFLQKAQPLKTRLILELKSHQTPEQETQAVINITQMVKKLGLEKRIEYISFSLHAIKEFVRLAPQGTPVYYLKGDLSPKQLKEYGCAGADYHLSVFKKHPEWINDCHQLGMKVNCWTIDKAEDMRWLINHEVDFITTNEPTLLQKQL